MGIERVQPPTPFIGLTATEPLDSPLRADPAESTIPTTGPVTREQILRRLEALERELKELKDAVRRLP
jgi:hypothetical protein